MPRPQANSFVLGSCFDEEHGLFAFEDKSVDHIITDTPYAEYVHDIGAARQYHANKKYRDESHDWEFAHFTEEDMIVFAECAVRICKGWILCFSDLESIGMWSKALANAGAKKHNTLIWTKRNAAPKFQGNGPASASEAVVTFWAGKGQSVWNAGGGYGHYHYSVDQHSRRHKTQKPLPLMRQFIIDFTMPGQLILDPFAGGGSTLIAAKQTHRDYIGYELGGDEDTRASYEMGREVLARVRPQTKMQMMMLHRQRKSRAYAGHRVKETAIHQQTWVDLVPGKPKRRARSLDDIVLPTNGRRVARSLDDY